MLRAPFLMTVVAAGALTSCGPEVVVNPPALECPENAPEAGEPCPDASGLRCEYAWCGTEYPTLTATCANDGTWAWVLAQSTCNPPPPGE